MILAISLASLGLACAAKGPDPVKAREEENLAADGEKGVVIDEEGIGGKLLEKSPDFNRCFEEEMARDKGFATKRVMSLFTLEKGGTASATGVVAVNQLSKEFKECFKTVISSISFPPAQGERPVLIFYPVEYRSSKKR